MNKSEKYTQGFDLNVSCNYTLTDIVFAQSFIASYERVLWILHELFLHLIYNITFRQFLNMPFKVKCFCLQLKYLRCYMRKRI